MDTASYTNWVRSLIAGFLMDSLAACDEVGRNVQLATSLELRATCAVRLATVILSALSPRRQMEMMTW